MEVSIEPGTPDEHEYVYSGEGNEIPGAEAGDLVVVVSIKKHRFFERIGADLALEKEITLKEALLGFTFTCKFLDGKQHLISSLSGEVTSSGTMKSVKGKGLPFFKDRMGQGNLIIKFSVKFPKGSDLTQESRALLDKVENL